MVPDDLVATRKRMRRLTVLVVVAVVVAVSCFALAACAAVDNTHSARSSAPDPVKSTKHRGGEPSPEDGVLPDNASPFDTSLPGVANLNPELLKAIQDAARAAEQAGIKLHLTTGWRSKEYQEELLEKAIKRYGSREKAGEYVATPEDSHHVTGNAVDVGPTDADDWLNRKGARFGLCQTLANEIWHFELATTPGGTCPPMKSTSSSR
jgi:zinc D-Ala-D-Ala carboxypeptidase